MAKWAVNYLEEALFHQFKPMRESKCEEFCPDIEGFLMPKDVMPFLSRHARSLIAARESQGPGQAPGTGRAIETRDGGKAPNPSTLAEMPTWGDLSEKALNLQPRGSRRAVESFGQSSRTGAEAGNQKIRKNLSLSTLPAVPRPNIPDAHGSGLHVLIIFHHFPQPPGGGLYFIDNYFFFNDN